MVRGNPLHLWLQLLLPLLLNSVQISEGSAQDDFLRAHRNSRDCEARGDGVFPDPQNCRFYYNCRNGVLSYSFRCPDGFVFHPTDRRCIASDNCVEKTFKPLIFAAGAQQDSQPISVTSELSDKRPAQLDKLALTDNLRPNNTVFIGGGRNSTGSPAIDGLVNIEALADSQANLISTQEVKILSNYTTQHFYRTTTTTVPSLQLGGHTAAQTYLLKVVFNRRQNDQFRTAFDTDTSGATNPFEADLNPLPRFQPSATVSSSPVVVNNVDSSTSEPQVAVTTSPLSTASSHTHFYNTNMTALVMNVSQSHQNITNNGSITVAAEFVMASNTSKISFSNSSINENITGIGNSSQFEFITYDSNSTEVNGNISSFAVTDSLRLFNNQSGINSTTNETDTNPTVYKNDTITEALSLTTTTANINDLNSRNRVQLSEDSIRSSSSSTDSNPSANITSNGHSAANQSNHTNPHTAVEAEANGNVTNNTYTVLFPPVSPRHEMLNETIKAIISSNEGQKNASEVLKASGEEDCKCHCSKGDNVTLVSSPKASQSLAVPSTTLIPVCHNFPCFNAGMFFSINHGKECGCVCPPGYQGLHCEELVERSLCHCANGGKCVRVGNSTYTCQCPLGFIGGQCEHGLGEIENPFASVIQVPEGLNTDKIHTDLNNIMICQTNICLNGGLCLKQLANNKSRCYCTGNYGGEYCEKRFDRPLDL